MKTLGILGGMGPQASIRFYQSVIEQSQRNHGVRRNNEFPHLLLSNLPVPDLITDKKMMNRAVGMVQRESKILQTAGADLLVLVCNTMHLFLDRYERSVTIPFLSIIDETVKKIQKEKRKCVGLLGSKTLMQSMMYQQKLEAIGIHTLEPDDEQQTRLSDVIIGIIAKEFTIQDMRFLQRIIRGYQSHGAEAVVLGCTELPLVLHNQNSPLPVYSSLDILAATCCEMLYGSGQSTA